MFRAFFVSLSRATWAQKWITRMPMARQAAARFVAGETQAQALQVVEQLNQRGILATLDHLGESTTRPGDAEQATAEILSLLDAIQSAGVQANVSIKLSQIGLVVDPALCEANLWKILTRARELGNFVRIDMEDSSLTQRTLDLYFKALTGGFAQHVGIVLQAYLYRTEADLTRVLTAGGRVRLCKGAYKEPPSRAFSRKSDVNLNFDQLALQMLRYTLRHGAPQVSSDGRTPPIPALATHDPQRIRFVRQAVEELYLSRRAVEFQMLYGIRRDLQESLTAEGFPVRVYVPYGTHWYPYFMRRLGERPANLWFFLKNFFQH
ncbi:MULTISPECIES: proline dehydrogenase family protein [Anaerolinea]|uniref:proline dehydrogenase family protein n=1 Tax=Anaerolinea TaxID=233189 RepID=UPI00262B50C2|nr:proline dehydrogenase family protein [Anaerolinea thermophila]